MGERFGNQRYAAIWKEAWDQWEIDDAIRSALALSEPPDSALTA